MSRGHTISLTSNIREILNTEEREGKGKATAAMMQSLGVDDKKCTPLDLVISRRDTEAIPRPSGS